MKIRPTRVALAVLIPVAGYWAVTSWTHRPQLGRIQLPDGFEISFFAQEVPNARQLALGTNGTVFAGTRREGNVYAVRDTDGDHTADETWVIASGLRMPSGIAFRDGALYVAAVSQILRFDDIEERLDNPPDPVVIRDDLPEEGHHGWKFIAFGPDGFLYVPVGAPCNVCNESNEQFASIQRMRPDGSELEVFAHGVRNSVGFDWDPRTGHLWFTDNGRDNLGDNRPADELNHAPEPGMHFGFPFCHAGRVPDPEFDSRSCDEFTPPAQRLGPHVAAIGMTFYTGDMFPETYRNRIFIAEHGSWNRTDPIGYRVMTVMVDGGTAGSYEPFAEGWLQGEAAWGRPADVLVMPDGALLVSDDEQGAIYRISYER